MEFVCSHHAAGARAAVEHLLRLGHTRIGYAERISPHTAPQVRSGLAAGLERAGLDPAPVVATSLRRWTGQDADRFLDHLLRQRATAALCFADREASLLVGAARRRGLRVPEDLSVVGYDNEVADLCEVPLTAVAPAKADIGRRAAELVRARIAHPDAPRRQEAPYPSLSYATPPARCRACTAEYVGAPTRWAARARGLEGAGRRRRSEQRHVRACPAR